MSGHAGVAPAAKEKLNLEEKGAPVGGEPQSLNRRLFFQFFAFSNAKDPSALAAALEATGLASVLYEDVNDPTGVGVAACSEQPEDFLTRLRPALTQGAFSTLRLKPEHTLLGRTYAIGREPDLEDWLLERQKKNVLNPQNRWAVWYPLRRKPEFALLAPQEQGKILSEHGMLGRTYAQGGYAADVRLACHGLDKQDNDFVIGLLGAELFPLSRLVQDMRKTQQTSRYLESLGPFFVGKVFWQSKM